MMSYHDNDHVVILGNKIMDPHLHMYSMWPPCNYYKQCIWVLRCFLYPLVCKAANVALLQTVENCKQEFEVFMSEKYLQRK